MRRLNSARLSRPRLRNASGSPVGSLGPLAPGLLPKSSTSSRSPRGRPLDRPKPSKGEPGKPPILSEAERCHWASGKKRWRAVRFAHRPLGKTLQDGYPSQGTDMSISDRTSNRTRPESLRRLLAEHEPESLRTFRRRWRFLVRIAAPGWVLLAMFGFSWNVTIC